MRPTSRGVLLVGLLLLAASLLTAVGAMSLGQPAQVAQVGQRMQIGFFDDPSFRWSPQAIANLASAQRAGATVVHTTANWAQIAPRKPHHPLNGDDPAYRLGDLDSLVRTAGLYDQQVMITIDGTPRWANGGQASNRPPGNLKNLTDFARMLATRYDGKEGHGVVTLWSIWNEPNLGLFLMPQFKGKKIVSAAEYVKLFLAGERGIKAANPKAQVAAGETSNRGRNVPIKGSSAAVAPATFARLVASIDPHLPMSAWATHPYPTSPDLGPTEQVRWPNVTMTQIPRLAASLQLWFHRAVPIWITEYAEQTKPQYPHGVSEARQARDAVEALKLAAQVPAVKMFTWFILRDSPSTWKSGLETASGAHKRAYAAFAATARAEAGASALVRPGRKPTLTIPVPLLTAHNSAGAVVGIDYRVRDAKNKVLMTGHAAGRISVEGTLRFVAAFKPVAARSYSVAITAVDETGLSDTRVVTLSTLSA
jgi:polysaccharide biosynthesis protein PslG